MARQTDDVVNKAIAEAANFVASSTHFHDGKTIAIFAIAEYILSKEGLSLYTDRLADSA